jgi:DNA-binding MarR family transcriptional regulator
VTLISFPKYHGGMLTLTIDTTELASRLRLGVTRLARRLRREAEPGITQSQLSGLATIERHGPMTIGELSGAEQVQPPTMTRIVAALVDDGLVARETDPDDRRMAWLRVTPEGVKLLQRSRKRKEAFLATQMRSLEPRQLAVLHEATGILEQIVEGDR